MTIDKVDPRAAQGVKTLQVERFLSTDTEEERDSGAVRTELTQPPDVVKQARQLATLIQQELDALEQPRPRARLLHILGLVIEHRQGDRRRAMYHLLEAHRLCPDNISYIRTLRNNLWARSNWPMVAQLADAEFNLLKETSRRAELLSLKAELLMELLGDADGALEAYNEALRLEPEELRLLARTRTLLSHGEAPHRQAEICRRYAAATTDHRLRSLLLTEAGRVHEEQLEQHDEALEAFSAALGEDPRNVTALACCRRILERLERHEELVEVLIKHAQRAGGRQRSRALMDAAEVCRDRLEQPARALELLARAHPGPAAFVTALETLCRKPLEPAGERRMLELMQGQLELLEDRVQRAEMLCFLGTRNQARTQHRQALHLLRQALELIPDHQRSLEAALSLLEQQQRWEEAVQLAQRALEWTEDDGLRLDLLHRLGRLCDRRLGDLDRAKAFYVRALAQEPEDLEALDALREIFWRSGEYERLTGILEQLALRATDDRDAVGYLYDKAQIVERHLPGQEVTSVYERILQLDATQVPALEALDRLHCAANDNARLCQVLSALSSREEDPQYRESLLLRLAGAREAVGDVASAAWALGMVAPQSDSWVMAKELRRLRQLQAQWDLVVESLEQEARLCTDVALRTDSLLTAAKILEDRLEAPDRAEAMLLRILELDPLHRPAAERLDLLLGSQGQWDRLADLQQRRLDVLEQSALDRPELVQTLLRLAEIQQRYLKQPRQAIASASRCLEIDPAHQPTLRLLAPLYAEQEQWQQAAQSYAQLMATCHDPAELRTILIHLGELWRRQLDDPLQAISCYQNILAVAPGDPEALQQLYELFVEVGDRASAADALSQLIEVTEDVHARARFHIALADLYDHDFDEPALAVEHLQQAQHTDPTNEEVLQRLKQLLTRLDQWEELCDAIRSFLAALPADQQDRGFAHRMELGQVFQHRLRRLAEGLEQFQAVIDMDPTNLAARHAAAQVLVEDNRLGEAIHEYREILEIDASDTRSLRQIRAIWTRMDDLEGAYAATAALVCVGDATDGERRFYKEQRNKGARYPRRCLESSAFEAVLVHPAEHIAGREVLAVLGRVAHLLSPPRLQEWGVGPRSLLSPQSEHPLPGVVAQVARVLGLEFRVDVHLSSERVDGLDLLLTDPPTLVVGQEVMESMPPMAVRGQVGRLLSYLRNGTWVAHGLGPGRLQSLVFGACLAATSSVDRARGRSEQELRQKYARQIQRSLGPEDMEELKLACKDLRKGREPEMKVWVQAMRHTELRTALWITNDLETILDLLLESAGEGTGPRARRALIHGSPLAMDLVRYWISEDFLSLRKSLR